MVNNWKTRRMVNRYYKDGTIQSMKGYYEKAIETLSKAIDLDPEFLDAYVNRGLAFMNKGNLEQAMADFSFVIQRRPDDATAYYNRSLVQMALGDNDAAIADLSEAIRILPLDPTSYNNRSIIHSLRKEYELAIADAKRAIELGDAVNGHINLAINYEKLGKYQEAIEEWTEVLRQDRNKPDALCRRGMLYEKVGKPEEAISDLKKGLKGRDVLSDPLKSDAEELLRKLEHSLGAQARKG